MAAAARLGLGVVSGGEWLLCFVLSRMKERDKKETEKGDNKEIGHRGR